MLDAFSEPAAERTPEERRALAAAHLGRHVSSLPGITYARMPMAPPKRKSGGGRITPKGVRPGDRHDSSTTAPHQDVAASSRYTPKQGKRQLVPPSWIPVIMLVLLIGGGLMIMARYLIFTDTNWPTLAGLVMILGGLYAATKWQ